METIAAMILAAAAIAFVGYPLFKPKPLEFDGLGIEDETIEDELVDQKEATFAAITELDFDHAMGNLSDQDHNELRDRYKLKALTLMKQIDEVEKARPPESPAATGQIEGTARVFCSGCGAKIDPDKLFCPKCGKSLSSGCPNCGSAMDPEDTFCGICGQKR